MVEQGKSTVSNMKPGLVEKPFSGYSWGKIITTPNGTWCYGSGEIGVTPQDNLISDEPGEQCTQALTNIKALAEANDFKMSDIIKATVYITDMKNQPAVNEAYCKFFDADNLPARSCIAVHQLPIGALVEIECIYFKP